MEPQLTRREHWKQQVEVDTNGVVDLDIPVFHKDNKQHNTTVECGVELQRVLIHPEARRCENRWHLNKCITAANAKHSAVVRKQKRKIALSLKG